ncbi:MAG: hypothetical protein E2P00_03290 [Acidobacteria bacterium]|nr:MAG: hypothetical protein E2P03_03280 [Acidobacteriota bacterium]TDI45661.1 MAG: hypothetical protein E2P00_03290 [Acidobacteriota bacterium]
MTDRPPAGPSRRPSPRWFHLLIGLMGVAAGALYLYTAFTAGPLGRNLVIGLIWAGMGLAWLLAGLIMQAKRGRQP